MTYKERSHEKHKFEEMARYIASIIGMILAEAGWGWAVWNGHEKPTQAAVVAIISLLLAFKIMADNRDLSREAREDEEEDD